MTGWNDLSSGVYQYSGLKVRESWKDYCYMVDAEERKVYTVHPNFEDPEVIVYRFADLEIALLIQHIDDHLLHIRENYSPVPPRVHCADCAAPLWVLDYLCPFCRDHAR